MEETKKIMDSMFDKLDQFLKTETVIGEPIAINNATVIPLISASFGLGGGFGEESKSKNGGGGGGGLGCKINPEAILLVKDDCVELFQLGTKKSLETLIEKAPDIISEIKKSNGKEKSNEKENEK